MYIGVCLIASVVSVVIIVIAVFPSKQRSRVTAEGNEREGRNDYENDRDEDVERVINL
jgi:hypothetical protein